ncbi:MAG: aldo/keto reductase [Ruminococcaceae bacterium]|nr:aldo/keto reductase [Oscillospiraceae bacterium]
MKYINVAGHRLSAMSLGTVQLGMNYGIANTGGQPDEAQSFDMLDAAFECGITSLDTARAYGNSEEVIGKYFASRGGEIPFITTKVVDIEGETAAEIESSVFSIVETSLEKLGLTKVNCIMLHESKDLFERGKHIASAMENLVKKGYTDIVGASVYTAAELGKMFEYDVYTATQVPMSIFDQRLIASGMTDTLAERGITAFVRSVFLQGLFFLDPEKITDPILVEYAVPKIKLLRECAETEGMSIAELAISYMRDVKGVSSLVLGADTATQVKANAAYFETKAISEKTSHLIKQSFADVNIPEIMKVLSRAKN